MKAGGHVMKAGTPLRRTSSRRHAIMSGRQDAITPPRQHVSTPPRQHATTTLIRISLSIYGFT